jgi:hypothetical protein
MHWATCQFQSLLWATCQLVCIGQRVNLHALDSVSTPKPPLGNVSTCMHWTTCQLVRIGQRVNLYALDNVSTCMHWATCQLVCNGQRVNLYTLDNVSTPKPQNKQGLRQPSWILHQHLLLFFSLTAIFYYIVLQKAERNGFDIPFHPCTGIYGKALTTL